MCRVLETRAPIAEAANQPRPDTHTERPERQRARHENHHTERQLQGRRKPTVLISAKQRVAGNVMRERAAEIATDKRTGHIGHETKPRVATGCGREYRRTEGTEKNGPNR